jgi:hypothetical protein
VKVWKGLRVEVAASVLVGPGVLVAVGAAGGVGDAAGVTLGKGAGDVATGPSNVAAGAGSVVAGSVAAGSAGATWATTVAVGRVLAPVEVTPGVAATAVCVAQTLASARASSSTFGVGATCTVQAATLIPIISSTVNKALTEAAPKRVRRIPRPPFLLGSQTPPSFDTIALARGCVNASHTSKESILLTPPRRSSRMSNGMYKSCYFRGCHERSC